MTVRTYIFALIFLTGCAARQPGENLNSGFRDSADLSEEEVLRLSAGAPAVRLSSAGSSGESYSQTAALSHGKGELKNVPAPAPAPAASENSVTERRVAVPVYYDPFFDVYPYMHYGSGHGFRGGIGVGTVIFRDL